MPILRYHSQTAGRAIRCYSILGQLSKGEDLMKLSKFLQLAGVSALALGTAFMATSANAVVQNNGTPFNIGVTALVVDGFDAVVTPLAFGTISVRPDAVDTATLEVEVDDNVIDDNGALAAIRSVGGTPAAATVVITQLFGNQAVTVDYVITTEPTLAGNTFDLDIEDSLAAGPLTLGTGTGQGSVIGGVATPGTATATALGELSFEIGGSLITQAGGTYPPGSYPGVFTIEISY